MAWCRLVKEQAITSTDVDQHLCHHMELLGQNRLTLKAKQNGNILQTAFSILKKKKHFCIMIQISLKLKEPVDKRISLVQVMAWCQVGNKPLLNSLRRSDAYMH